MASKPTYAQLIEMVHQLEAENTLLESRFQQTEKQLRQRQRMDSLGTLAHGVAHDFNNILSGIMAYLNILSLTSDNFSPAQKTYVQNIINSVKRGAATVRQFQSLSRESQSPKTCVDIYAVAREVFELMEETTDKMIEKRLEIPEGNCFIFADANEIHQVLMNLGTNAVHAIEEKGARQGDYICLTVKPCIDTAGQEADFLNAHFYRFCFEDTGVGMSEAIVQQAFNPLFTTKTAAQKNGQGLGLAMVQDIVVKGHGGQVTIESTPGKGTVFNLLLPKGEATMPDVEPAAAIQGGSETILVVDDDTAVRESIQTALEDFGYRVICAADGEDGLRQFQRNHRFIDAVLLDMVMPKMSGKELLEKMMKIDPEVKVIISSGHDADQYDDTILRSAKNYLRKPFEIDALDKILRAVLELPV